MVCLTCSLDNPSTAETCVQCGTTLHRDPPPAPPVPSVPTGYQPAPAWTTPVLATAALAVLAIGAVWYLRGGGPAQPPPPTPSPVPPPPTPPPAPSLVTTGKDQALAVDALLGDSVASRRLLNDAIDRIRRCPNLTAADLTGAVADLHEVGRQRQRQLSTLAAADVSALAGGDLLRATLRDGLTGSLQADEAFVRWGEPTVSGNCADTDRRELAYADAQRASERAQAAKRQFLQQWNPLATRYGLAARSERDV